MGERSERAPRAGRSRRTAGRRNARLSPSSSRIGARSASSRCWTMCIVNRRSSPSRSIGETSAISTTAQAARERERAQRVAGGRVAAARRRRAAQVAQPPRVRAARERRPRRAPGAFSDHVYSTARGSSGTSHASGIVPAVVSPFAPCTGSCARWQLAHGPARVAGGPAAVRRVPRAGARAAVRCARDCCRRRSCRSRPGQAAHRSPALDARVGAVRLRGRRPARGDGV